jgi:hypothetical protein
MLGTVYAPAAGRALLGRLVVSSSRGACIEADRVRCRDAGSVVRTGFAVIVFDAVDGSFLVFCDGPANSLADLA